MLAKLCVCQNSQYFLGKYLLWLSLANSSNATKYFALPAVKEKEKERKRKKKKEKKKKKKEKKTKK